MNIDITKKIKQRNEYRKFKKNIESEILKITDKTYVDKYSMEIEWLKKHPCGGRTKQIQYPYPWTEEYAEKLPVVESDIEGYPKISVDNKALFFRKGTKKKTIVNSWVSLAIEQDERSPHCYCNEEFPFPRNSVMFDIGAAEASFTLSHIDEIRYAYLFEADPAWNNALRKTFEPYKDKVKIINKYVGNKNDDNNITLNQFLKEVPEEHRNNVFVKMDIEGAEVIAISCAADFFHAITDVNMSVCTYHRYEDERDIKGLFDSSEWTIKKSNGVMLVDTKGLGWEDNRYPWFRTGLLHLKK